MSMLISLAGILVLVGIAWLLSSDRKSINWRTVIGAFLIQACFGAFVLYIPFGKDVLGGISSAVQQVMNYANEGITFVFGDLARFKVGFVFAINVLPMIIFFSALISVLYHLGVMQRIIQLIGGALQRALGTSRTESLSATGNIFVGQTEAPLLVKPYIATMTRSELFAVMVGGAGFSGGFGACGLCQPGCRAEILDCSEFYGGARWFVDG